MIQKDSSLKINWFPGHMKKTTDEINKLIKHIDIIIEVIDSRAIKSSSNPDLNKLVGNKPILQIALKQDLSSRSVSYSNQLIISNLNDKNLRNQILTQLNNLISEKKEKLIKKGLVNPKFLVLVMGLPNVGKSSLINLLKAKKSLEAHNYPGVTKKMKIVNIDKNFDLIDSPGVFIKNIDNFELAYKLALLNNIKREVLNLEEIIKYGLDFINNIDPNAIKTFYKLENDYLDFYNFLDQIKPRYLSKNQELDENKLFNNLFNDISEGKILKFIFD